MIVKFQTPFSLLRLDVNLDDTIYSTITQNLSPTFTCTYNNHPITSTDTYRTLNIQHGHTIKVDCQPPQPDTKKQTDSIKQEMGAMCNHPKSAVCTNCLPLDVYDKNYYRDNNIKYISFRAYLKKVNSKERACECVRKCECIKVRPLMPQEYRFVDHVQMHCKNQVEEVINGYRGSLRQRMALLVGKVDDYEMVPLGRKVDVMYIYEVGQENYPDGVVFCDEVVEVIRLIANEQCVEKKKGRRIGDNKEGDEGEIDALIDEFKMYLNDFESSDDSSSSNETDREIKKIYPYPVDEYKKLDKKQKENVKSILALRVLLKKNDLKIVGILYTDLQKHPRKEFLSPLEVIFISKLQLMFSKTVNDFLYTDFVTILMTKVDATIELFEYQISEQCMCLVKNEMLTPTKTTLLSNCELYYFEKDEYDNVVRKFGYEVPVDFFLVRLTHGYKVDEVDDYFHWAWNEKKLKSYFDNDFEKSLNINVWIKLMLMGHINLDKLEDELVCKMRSTKTEWTCERCTYVNLPGVDLCDMCGQNKA